MRPEDRKHRRRSEFLRKIRQKRRKRAGDWEGDGSSRVGMQETRGLEGTRWSQTRATLPSQWRNPGDNVHSAKKGEKLSVKRRAGFFFLLSSQLFNTPPGSYHRSPDGNPPIVILGKSADCPQCYYLSSSGRLPRGTASPSKFTANAHPTTILHYKIL